MNFKPIRIVFVDQPLQRIPGQVGDYWESKRYVEFRITRLEGLRSMYVAIHELWEKYIKDRDNITDESVDQFDLAHPELSDPGLSQEAPYHPQHMQSDALERMCCIMAGDDWIDYEKEIERLFIKERG